MEDETFNIDDIYIPVKRKSTLNLEKVQAIAESILEEGQKRPIHVRRDRNRVV